MHARRSGMLAWLIFRNYLLSRRSGALVRVIAWHCVLGIGMGVAALIIVLSVMNGFNLTIRSRMLSIEPHLVITEKETPTPRRQAVLRALLSRLSAHGVQAVERYEKQDMIVRSVDGTFAGTDARGYDASGLSELVNGVYQSLRKDTPPPMAESSDLKKNEIVLGVDLARTLGIFEGDEALLILPETLLLPKGEIPKFQKFKVKSLINTQNPEYDSKFLFYNLDLLPDRMRSLSHEHGFEVRLLDAYEADPLKAKLAAQGIASQSWSERDSALFFALKMESLAMTLFLSLAVLITSFSIVMVMVMLINQKRQDIGMLMALGLSARRAKWVFVQVGLYLSYLGILGGVIVGSVVCLILDRYPMELLPDIYTDSTLPAKLNLRILLFVLGSSTVIALLGSWLPVWRYIMTEPSAALRKPAEVQA